MPQENTAITSETITVEGEVVDILPGLEYMVRINYQGMEHDVKCYVSGKMKSHFIQIAKGDEVRIEISLYDINQGRIVYRLTKRKIGHGPPRRPKK